MAAFGQLQIHVVGRKIWQFQGLQHESILGVELSERAGLQGLQILRDGLERLSALLQTLKRVTIDFFDVPFQPRSVEGVRQCLHLPSQVLGLHLLKNVVKQLPVNRFDSRHLGTGFLESVLLAGDSTTHLAQDEVALSLLVLTELMLQWEVGLLTFP